MGEQHIRITRGEIDLTPEEAGYDAKQLEVLDEVFARITREKQVQGASYLLCRDNGVFAHRAMGVLDGPRNSGELMPDSIRRIASMSKPFTGVAIMQLMEDGLLYPWQTVSTVIEEFDTPLHRGIEIKHLLTHTSGLPADGNYFLEPYPFYQYARLEEKNWIKAFLSGPLQAEPGKAWNYCSMGYAVLGEVITRVSGMDCHDYIMERIVRPLGMERTFFEVPKELQGEVCIIDEWDRERMLSGLTRGGPPRVGGGLYSTLKDISLFARMLMNEGIGPNGTRILGRATVEMMTSNHVSGPTPAYHWGNEFTSFPYGLGVKVYPDGECLISPGSISHEGAGRCAMYIDPSEKFAAIWFVPSTADWVPESMIHPKNIIWAGIQ